MSTHAEVPKKDGEPAHGSAEQTKQDGLTQSVGRRLEPTEARAPWWKRLLGRS